MLFLIKSLSTSSELMGLNAKISTLRAPSKCHQFPVGLGDRDGAVRGCQWQGGSTQGGWHSAGSSSLPAASPLTRRVPDPGTNPAPGGWRGPNVPGLWAERNLFCESELLES